MRAQDSCAVSVHENRCPRRFRASRRPLAETSDSAGRTGGPPCGSPSCSRSVRHRGIKNVANPFISPFPEE